MTTTQAVRVLVAAAVVAVVTAAPPARSSVADGGPLLAGDVVSGSVLVSGRAGALAFVSFVGEARPGGGVRLVTIACHRDGYCAWHREDASGALTRTPDAVRLRVRSVAVGTIDISGQVRAGPALGSDRCRVTWAGSGDAATVVEYDVSGVQHALTWQGRLGGLRAWAPNGFGCGRSVNPGAIRMS